MGLWETVQNSFFRVSICSWKTLFLYPTCILCLQRYKNIEEGEISSSEWREYGIRAITSYMSDRVPLNEKHTGQSQIHDRAGFV